MELDLHNPAVAGAVRVGTEIVRLHAPLVDLADLEDKAASLRRDFAYHLGLFVFWRARQDRDEDGTTDAGTGVAACDKALDEAAPDIEAPELRAYARDGQDRRSAE